ncbi:MAG: carbohydrate ABC transporter permease [Clostridia bacterium]|nr:carbohydrate ABC transporter permease [Clostridia bacterium]
MKNRKKILLQEIAFLFVSVVMWIPIYYFVISAFKERTEIVKHPLSVSLGQMSFDNFIYVWDNMKIGKSIANTAMITAGTLALTVVVSSLAGFALARIREKFFDVMYAYVVVLMVVPFISCLLMLVRLSTSLDLYNTVLGAIFIHTAWHIPFCTFLFTGFMRAMPVELEESAYIDGCSTTRVYAQIFLPLLTPVIATCCIRSGITIWNDYLVSKSLLNSVRTPTIMVSISSFFGEYVSEYGYAFAGIVIASLPITIMFIFLQKYFIKGLTAGAVKG